MTVIDKERLARLAKALDNRAKKLVKTEEDRALAAEAVLDKKINNKQEKTDKTLSTNDKTIVGAINEIKKNIKILDALTLNNHKIWVGTPSELDKIVNKDPNTLYFELNNDKVTVVENSIVNGVLKLTTDKYQKTKMVNGTVIEFPKVSDFTEIHLYFNATSNLSLKLPPCKWRVEPNIEAGNAYEIVFTYNTMDWLVNVLVYTFDA